MKEEAMSDNKEILTRYYDRVFNSREVGAIAEYWADEKMQAAVTRGCISYLDSFPDLHISLEELIEEDGRVFVRSTMTGTHDGEYKGIARPPAGTSPPTAPRSTDSPTGRSSATGASSTSPG